MVTELKIRNFLKEVSDPEVPVLSVLDLGVIREINVSTSEILIKITPTYSGCPAMKVIEEDILKKLTSEGIKNVTVELVLSPAWTTDWITEEGKEKLRSYGIAPPQDEVDKSVLFSEPTKIICPHCKSNNTRMISLFGSTSCKAHYNCNECLEPFDYFKCLK